MNAAMACGASKAKSKVNARQQNLRRPCVAPCHRQRRQCPQRRQRQRRWPAAPAPPGPVHRAGLRRQRREGVLSAVLRPWQRRDCTCGSTTPGSACRRQNRINPKETSMRVQNQSIIVTGAGSGIGERIPKPLAPHPPHIHLHHHHPTAAPGAGSGIGEGIAHRLAAEGGKVIVNDIDAASGQRVVADITAAGGTASFFQADMTRSAQVEALIDEALRRNGRLDVMVNNAGWTHRNRPLLEVSEDEFDKVYAINVKSIYLSAIHAVPAMRKAGGGSFINIASTAGLRPRPGLTWYNGSKGAVITTSKSMAAELGPDNIRVNCINPVFNPDTGLSADFAGGPVDETRRAKFLATIPLGPFSTALDVANAVLYLASAEAAFISGVCLEVDGARCV